MGEGVILQTERLLLREFEPSDVEPLQEVLGDPIAMQYYPAPFDRRDIEDWVRRNRARYADAGFGLWAMLLKASREVIGDCGCFVREIEGACEYEMGWHVRRDQWNRGYASEAVRACIEFAFSHLGARRIIALVRPENRSSCRVAEKSGMTLEREIFWRDYRHRVYAIERI